jgi:hypothetical protein
MSREERQVVQNFPGTRMHLTLGGDTLKRITKAALGGLAGCALVLGGVQSASGETLLQQVFPGWLIDLDINGLRGTTGAFDSAKAKLKVIEASDGNTTFSIELRGINPDFANQEFGSHLHVGGCETDDDTGTGGHYAHPADPNNPTQPLREREVWFDLVPNEDGVAVDQTMRPFVPEDEGVMSIVIHAQDTAEPGDPAGRKEGSAGPKEVCLPVDVSTTWALR